MGVHTINVDGTDGQEIIIGMDIWHFDWSPDGTKIAFAAKAAPNEESEIYVANADGSNIRRVTNNQVQDGIVVWSPDGKRIAYATEQDGNSEIYVMNADGSGKRNLTHHPAKDGSFDLQRSR